MSKSATEERLIRRVLIQSVLLVLLIAFSQGQTKRQSSCDIVSDLEPIKYARCLASDFFPEAAGRNATIQITVHNAFQESPVQNDRSFEFLLVPAELENDLRVDTPEGPNAAGDSKPNLLIIVSLEKDRTIRELTVLRSPADHRSEEVRKEIAAHPEWTDADVTRFLNERSARFGPDKEAEFRRSLPLDKLQKYLGKVKLTSARFVINRSGGPQDTFIEWNCELAAGSRKYNVAFDPVDGSLSRIGSVAR